MEATPPRVAVTTLAGRRGNRVLVVGPSLGTRVERLWGSTAWALATGELAAGAHGLHVVGWDLPGHGASPTAAGRFSLDDLARGVLGAVERELTPGASDEPWLVAGDSIGGAVSLLLLLSHPERFAAGAVLCSSARFGAPQGWADRAALVRAEGMAPMVAASPDRWFGSRVASTPTESSRCVVAELCDIDPEGYAQVCEALGRYDVTGDLGRITAPLLAVAGADDVATPPESMAELVARVPRGRLAVLPGVGHLAPLEDPEATAALLASHFTFAGATEQTR
jgi:pimeloyl-ACP methyl ester carboxylesterase